MCFKVVIMVVGVCCIYSDNNVYVESVTGGYLVLYERPWLH